MNALAMLFCLSLALGSVFSGRARAADVDVSKLTAMPYSSMVSAKVQVGMF